MRQAVFAFVLIAGLLSAGFDAAFCAGTTPDTTRVDPQHTQQNEEGWLTEDERQAVGRSSGWLSDSAREKELGLPAFQTAIRLSPHLSITRNVSPFVDNEAALGIGLEAWFSVHRRYVLQFSYTYSHLRPTPVELDASASRLTVGVAYHSAPSNLTAEPQKISPFYYAGVGLGGTDFAGEAMGYSSHSWFFTYTARAGYVFALSPTTGFDTGFSLSSSYDGHGGVGHLFELQLGLVFFM